MCRASSCAKELGTEKMILDQFFKQGNYIAFGTSQLPGSSVGLIKAVIVRKK
jgi:hypothetical protein